MRLLASCRIPNHGGISHPVTIATIIGMPKENAKTMFVNKS